MHPKTQLKRKTNKILNAFSVSASDSSGASNALFADGLYATAVKTKVEASSLVAKNIVSMVPAHIISRDHIVMAVQKKASYIKQLVHSPGDFNIQKVSPSSYTVSFSDTIEIELKRLPLKETLKTNITFTFSKTEDKWLLSEVLIIQL